MSRDTKIIAAAATDLHMVQYLNGDEHMGMVAEIVKLHGKTEHLLDSFTHVHPGKERMAGLTAVSSGFAFAVGNMHMTPSDVAEALKYKDVDIDFVVGREGRALRGEYLLKLSRDNGDIKFSLESRVSGKEATFTCSEGEMKQCLGIMITVDWLRLFGDERLSKFMETGKIDLSFISRINADFQGADLRGANLLSAILDGVDLRGADLSYASLLRARLGLGAGATCADLQDANLTGANLTDADLTGADLTGANLYRANLTGANLTGANLEGADLYHANLTGANLYHANLEGANLEGADLYFANLTGANLKGANLKGANLKGANLKGADLRGATLTDEQLAFARSAGAILE
ncbi:TPA: pentapeptide repeat-containing protein [Citrobacter youngae]|nr:pentapeptide repeat-containing protein [Citrobacter youngae]HEF0093349.1 pentapeptide repeat-containing protein [Citrobacter youngae]